MAIPCKYLGRACSNYFEIVELKDDIIPSAETAYTRTVDRFNRGKSDYLDVLDAQRTFLKREENI